MTHSYTRADRKNKMAALASDWLRHFRLLLWCRLTEFNETWQEARSQRLLPICVFRADRKNKMAVLPSDWLNHFRLLHCKLDGIQQNLTGCKISTPSTKFVFSGRSEKQVAILASDWLRHFRLLLWNRLTEFNETWQEARSQRPLSSLYFSGRSEKQDGRPFLWMAEIFSNTPLKPLNGIQGSLTGSKISTSSTKFVFVPIGKRWPPLRLIGLDIFDFSETAEWNSKELDGKQDLNVFCLVCVFQADE